MTYLLAIDQGTSSTRACLFDKAGKILSMSQKNIQQHYPKEGYVEQLPEDIWQSTLSAIKEVILKQNIKASDIKACGIANQRETTLLWDKKTEKPIGNAIVWSDRRGAAFCKERKLDEAFIREKTGLLLDPYFSATKIAWLLKRHPEAKHLLKEGRLLFGTIDTFLIWRLSKGQSHVTDLSNAQRTLLCDIDTHYWDEALCEYFEVPTSILPEIKSSNAHFGNIDADFFGSAIPITGVLGDQQAALIGQVCVSKGMMKITYGTGAFLMLNTGTQSIRSETGLLSTVAYQINDEVTYALEGSIFNAGTVVKWLRDRLGLINMPSETETFAKALPDNGGVYLVPGFTGLGAPFWAPDVRASYVGMKLDSDKRYLVRAALESVGYQTCAVLNAMRSDCDCHPVEMRVDGGMVVNNWLLQFIANTCCLNVKRPKCIETTARGAAFIAGLGAGVYKNVEALNPYWYEDKTFSPDNEHKKSDYQQWQRAVLSACEG